MSTGQPHTHKYDIILCVLWVPAELPNNKFAKLFLPKDFAVKFKYSNACELEPRPRD